MEMKVMRCPGCGSELEIENGIDIFYCKYCGNKIVLEQSDEAIKAKSRAKMVNDISDKTLNYIRERREYRDRKQKENLKLSLYIAIGMVVFVLLFSVLWRHLYG